MPPAAAGGTGSGAWGCPCPQALRPQDPHVRPRAHHSRWARAHLTCSHVLERRRLQKVGRSRVFLLDFGAASRSDPVHIFTPPKGLRHYAGANFRVPPGSGSVRSRDRDSREFPSFVKGKSGPGWDPDRRGELRLGVVQRVQDPSGRASRGDDQQVGRLAYPLLGACRGEHIAADLSNGLVDRQRAERSSDASQPRLASSARPRIGRQRHSGPELAPG